MLIITLDYASNLSQWHTKCFVAYTKFWNRYMVDNYCCHSDWYTIKFMLNCWCISTIVLLQIVWWWWTSVNFDERHSILITLHTCCIACTRIWVVIGFDPLDYTTKVNVLTTLMLSHTYSTSPPLLDLTPLGTGH